MSERLRRFHEGWGWDSWRCFGAWPARMGGESGFRFRLWAPRARNVWVEGDFSHWQPVALKPEGKGMERCWQGFVGGVQAGQLYKFRVEDCEGAVNERADPYGRAAELRPGSASRAVGRSEFPWADGAWQRARKDWDFSDAAVSIYELHLGSWRRHDDGQMMTYRQLAEPLIAHMQTLGFTHVEFLPLAEHPYDPSWGYQVTGHFAPTSRHGSPDDLRYLVDALHQAGIGAIVDWVPAHFPRDGHGLQRLDGAELYESPDPTVRDHPDWGTLVFDFCRPQVRSFLLASACYWIEELHFDGLRVDAVASMIYRDYSRDEGQWHPNIYGGTAHLDAVSLLQQVNREVRTRYPGVMTIAEESTAFPRVSGRVPPMFAGHEEGLGFSLKWSMGWMHDTLAYVSRDPVHRCHHHNEMTFASSYAATEAFVLPLSHDEVVHLKGSLVAKMGGDWQAGVHQLRLLFGFQWTHPGKKLLFMGGELAQEGEWDFDAQLPWHQADDPARQGLMRWLADLNCLYRDHRAMHAGDCAESGLRWLDADDRDRSIYAWLRVGDGRELAVVANFTGLDRPGYVLRLPTSGTWRVVLHSTLERYGGWIAAPPAAMPTGDFDGQPGILFDLPGWTLMVLELAAA